MTSASSTDWALGLQARSRALLSQGDEAEYSLLAGRSPSWGGPGCDSISPEPTCSTANGYAANAAELTLASNCGPPIECSTPWAQTRSPNEPVENYKPRARQLGNAQFPADTQNSHRKKLRLHEWPVTGCRIPKSAHGSSSAPTPSSTTYAKSTRSSESVRGPNFNAAYRNSRTRSRRRAPASSFAVTRIDYTHGPMRRSPPPSLAFTGG